MIIEATARIGARDGAVHEVNAPAQAVEHDARGWSLASIKRARRAQRKRTWLARCRARARGRHIFMMQVSPWKVPRKEIQHHLVLATLLTAVT